MAEFSNQIDWDGKALYIEAATDVGRVTCKVPRDTVHVIRLYSDAIGRDLPRGASDRSETRSLPAGEIVVCRGRTGDRIASV